MFRQTAFRVPNFCWKSSGRWSEFPEGLNQWHFRRLSVAERVSGPENEQIHMIDQIFLELSYYSIWNTISYVEGQIWYNDIVIQPDHYISLWINYNNPTATFLKMMVSRGNHRKIALAPLVSWLVLTHLDHSKSIDVWFLLFCWVLVNIHCV